MAHLKRFVVIAAVKLAIPELIVGAHEPSKARGYYQKLGVTADSEESAIGLVDQDVTAGRIVWEKSKIEAISETKGSSLISAGSCLDREAFATEKSGIWYRSGRAFYL